MKNILKILLDYNKWLLILLLVTTVFLSLKLNKVEMKEDEETFIAADQRFVRLLKN